MNSNEYLDNILSKVVDIKEVKSSAEKLKNSVLLDWLSNNPNIMQNTSPFDVCTFLQKMTVKMVSAKVRNEIIGNLYDVYSVIFAIYLNKKTLKDTEKKKITNIFYNIHLNTSKFTMFEKPGLGKNLRKIVNSDNVLCECFWIIPFFCKPQIILSMNIDKYIHESQMISKYVDGYIEGYENFVFDENIDIPALKLHIYEGAAEYQKILNK